MKQAILAAFLLFVASFAQAQSRTSADYSIVTDTLDGGGQQTTSADYTNDGSLGPYGSTASASNPVETNNSGYIGQLYNIIGLYLTAPTATPPPSPAATGFGGYPVQVYAVAEIDDQTVLDLSGTSINWSITSGTAAVAGIDSDGLVTTNPVGENSNATIQGEYDNFSASLALTVSPANFSSDSILQTLPNPTNCQLTVQLQSADGTAFGAVSATVPGWRLAGETIWHSSGDTISGLAQGDYVLEFESIVNSQGSQPFLPAPGPADELLGPGNNLFTFTYPSVRNTQVGSLEVVISPSSVANNPAPQARGQWQFLGETSWRDSGSIVTGIPAGFYLLDFKVIPSYAPVPTQTVQITVTSTTVEPVSYQAESTNMSSGTGALPSPLSTEVAGTEPYDFIGEIVTNNNGTGTGAAVTDRTVLTAAHVIFNDATESYATGVQWEPQEYAGEVEPEPIIPPGAYVLSGYAAARSGTAITVDVGTPQSQEDDAAALYFFNAYVDGGGSSGYLVSTGTTVQWLLQSRSMLLAGYPASQGDTSASVVAGQPQGTPPTMLNFTQNSDYQGVFTTPQIAGLPGMSGGPLCVQFDDGHFYPAGIYLGVDPRAVVRSIDSSVQSLIQSAELSSQDDQNQNSGGVIGSSFNFAVTPEPASLTVNFASGGPSDGMWQLLGGGDGMWHPGGYTMTGLTTNILYRLSFQPVHGYSPPAAFDLGLAPGSNTVTRDYSPMHAPVITTNALPIGAVGLAYKSQIAGEYSPKNFEATVTSSTGVSLSSLGLSLSNSGKLTGTPTQEGDFTLAVTAANAIGRSGTQYLDLMISSTGSLTISYNPAQGKILMGKEVLVSGTTLTLPQGTTVELVAVPKSAAFIFGGWNASGSFTLPGLDAPPDLQDPLFLTVAPSIQLLATFSASPYPALSGEYVGLVSGTTPTFGTLGAIGLSLHKNGSFSGKLSLGAATYPLAGMLDDTGAYVQQIKRAKLILGLTLQADLSGSSNTITGVLTESSTDTDMLISAEKAANGALNPALNIGKKYTLVFPHPAVSTAPQGDGYGAVTVTADGAVRLVGKLGDGTPLSESGMLTTTGTWPFYALIDGKKGVVTGLLSFEETGTTDIDGTLVWLAPASSGFPQGVQTTVEAIGSKFVSDPLLGDTSANVAIGGGDIVAPAPFEIGLTAQGKLTQSEDGLTLTIDRASGLISGTFLDGSPSPDKRRYSGALFQKTNSAYGVFSGSGGQSGYLEITGTTP